MSDWIKCSERMPKIDQLVLCWASCLDTTYGWYEGRGRWIVNDEPNDSKLKLDRITFVTYWQPLPEPPKGEND